MGQMRDFFQIRQISVQNVLKSDLDLSNFGPILPSLAPNPPSVVWRVSGLSMWQLRIRSRWSGAVEMLRRDMVRFDEIWRDLTSYPGIWRDIAVFDVIWWDLNRYRGIWPSVVESVTSQTNLYVCHTHVCGCHTCDKSVPVTLVTRMCQSQYWLCHTIYLWRVWQSYFTSGSFHGQFNLNNSQNEFLTGEHLPCLSYCSPP